VLASETESHPIAAIEALAAGKVMIAPGVVGLAEMIEDGRTGVLYPPGDVDALAELVVRYAESTPTRAEIERRIADVDLGRYDIGVLADEHLRVWQSS
jgi:glycosyltransferase involved in cell wall biosynthesis